MQAIETAQGRIDELEAGNGGHTEAAPVETVQPDGDKAEPAETAQPDGGKPVVIAPQVNAPAATDDTERVNMDDIYSEIDRIVSAEPDSMSADEKVAALNALKEDLNVYVDDLNSAMAEISQQQTALEASAGSITELEKSLSDAQARVDALTTEIEQSNAAVSSLQTQIDELQAANQSASDEADARIAELDRQMAEEQARADALNQQLTEAQALLAEYEAQLKVYMLSRDLGNGEAYTAATLNDRISVEAGTTHAVWGYTNNTISGNAVIISLELDGEALYRSEALKPGEALAEFDLDRPLEAGEYAAVAIATVYSNGEAVSATRVPVSIIAE